MKVIDEHGADALRLYLINSPVVRAESLKFKEEGVQATVREVLLPWFNAFRFFVQQVQDGSIARALSFLASASTFFVELTPLDDAMKKAEPKKLFRTISRRKCTGYFTYDMSRQNDDKFYSAIM